MSFQKTSKETTTKKEPLLIKILRLLVYSTALVPLIIWNDYLSPFHFGKGIIFRSGIELLAVLYLFVLLKYGKGLLPPLTKLFWAITAFTAAFGLTTLTSVNAYQSMWGTLERMGGWFSFFHFWLFFVIASAILRKKDEWLNFIIFSVWVSLASSAYGFLQKTDLKWIIGSGGRNKIFGTIGNPALFAGYIIINTFLALMLASLKKISNLNRFFYFSIFILDSLAIFLTGVRGSVMGLVVGVFIFGFLYAMDSGSKLIKKASITFLILVVVAVGLLAALKNTDFVRSNHYLARYADVSVTSYTVQTRVWAWQAGFKGLFQSFKYFIVGFGPENFNIPFSEHFNPKFFDGPGSETLFDRAHNQFIEVLVTMGILGFLTYLSIYYLAFKNISPKNLPNDAAISKNEISTYRAGLFSGMVAYIIHNSFIFDTIANYLMFFLVLGFINYLNWVKIRHPNYNSADTHKGSGLGSTLTAGVIITSFLLVLFSIYKTEVRPTEANYATTRAIVATWSDNHDEAIKKFKEALTYDTFGKYEIRHRFAQYVIEHYSGGDIDDKISKELFWAIDETKKNIPEYPRDYLPYLYISRAYIILGRSNPKSPYNDLSLENSQKALEISPTFIRALYEEAQAYLNKKDYKAAAEVFKKTIELNPAVGVSWWYLGITQAESGDSKAGANSIKEAVARGYQFSNNEQDILRVLNLYIDGNDYATISGLYQDLINLKPKNPQYHASLAAALAKLGKIDEAVNEARAAVLLDKSFEHDASVFVKSLGREL